MVLQLGLTTSAGTPATDPSYETNWQHLYAIQSRYYTLPVQSPLHVMLKSPINTALNHVNDPVEAIVLNDIYLYDQLILSKNTQIKGVISLLEPPIEGRNAVLAVRFTQMTMSDGQVLPMSAYVLTPQSNHVWGGELTPGTQEKVVTFHVLGIGDYNKLVARGKRAMGSDLSFSPGEPFTIILDQPLQLPLNIPDVASPYTAQGVQLR
jgi:hypothetical protein